MSLIGTAHIIVAPVVILTAAHLGGQAFLRLRQPRVIGEIVGGLLLGPTVLGFFLPDVQHWLFPDGGPGVRVLTVLYHVGLLLLVYLIGMELRHIGGTERRTVGWIIARLVSSDSEKKAGVPATIS